MKFALRSLLLAVALALFASAFSRHPANVPSARVHVNTDGTVELHVRFDVLAFCLEATPQEISDRPMNALLDGPSSELANRLADAQNRFRSSVSVATDNGNGSLDSILFPTVADVLNCAAENGKQRLPVMLTVVVKEHLPAGATTISCRLPDLLGCVVVTTELPYEEPVSEPVDARSSSTPLQIPSMVQVAKAKADVRARSSDSPLPLRGGTSTGRSGGVAAFSHPPEVTNSRMARTVPGPTNQKDLATVAKITQQVSAEDAGSGAKGVQPASASDSRLVAKDSRAGEENSDPGAKARGPGLALAASREAVGEKGHVHLVGRSVEGRVNELQSNRQVTEQRPTDGSRPMTPVGRPAWYVMFGRYVRMGYKHILPQGLDHILFVLGLFLLSRKTKALLTQISAFTIAHSITLGLSLYGVFSLPPPIVEPLIALSIVFVAVENLFTTEMKAWRPFVVFGFGLVHGLGFAGALKDAGLARGDVLTGLVGFNAGVELGQLSVVAMALLAVGWMRSRPSYRMAVVTPASCAIALVALVWAIQRTF